MIKNHPEVQAWLDAGNSLVVPSVQRAAAVRLAHAAEHYRNGELLWPSPNVLPWHAWLTRERSAAAPAADQCRRTLSSAEDWLLWRSAVRNACADLQLVSGAALVDAIQRSVALLDEWGLELRQRPTAEAELLHAARQLHYAYCQRVPAAPPGQWLRGDGPPQRPTWVLGFAELGTAWREQLQRRDARLGWPDTAVARPARATIRCECAPDPDAEFERLAAWCRQQLQRDPEARLLIVIPRLVHYLPRVRRALAAALDTDGAASNTTALYAFESGVPLVDYPLIETALTLLRCATGTQVFLAWSVLLRSPYLDCGGWRWRAQFERWLRLNNVTELDWNRFRHLPLRCGSDPQGSSLQSLDRLLLLPPGGETSAAAWAQHFAALLEAAGWPGPNPGSNEQQVRLRFEQLLGEMAAAHEAAGPLDQLEALELLGAWAQRARFEVASGDVAVTVTDSIDEPLVRYDGIWVAGLSADVWPPAASGDAFIPFSILAGSGMSTRSAAGQQQRARGAMQAWESATTTVVYSWPRQLDDAELEPSPLLAVAAVAASATGTSASASERLHPWRSGRMQLAAPTESCGADMARPWPRGQHARGGVSLIQSQALCPFRASATARLQCRPLPAPVDGMPPPLHGQIVHRALQGLWRELGDSAALALPEGHLRAVIEQQVAKAIVEFRGRTVMRLAAAVWQIEQRRCIEVIARLLPLERQREPFSVLASETELQLVVGGLPLSLRLDRVDQLPGASLHTIIIDYKTGKPAASADWLAERPAETQLLLYAEGAGDELCAVATLHAHTSEVRFSGVADQVGRLPRVGSVRGASWPELRSLWHERMSALGAAFVAGVADVAPQKRACDYCHLRVLCRVDADRVGDDVAAGADGGDDE